MENMRFIRISREEEIQARTVIAENLPLNYSLENLEKVFWMFGRVTSFRVRNPQDPNLAGCSRDVLTIGEGWGNKRTLSSRHAIVEYETTQQANNAIRYFYPNPRHKNGFFVLPRRYYSVASESYMWTRSDKDFNLMNIWNEADAESKTHRGM